MPVPQKPKPVKKPVEPTREVKYPKLMAQICKGETALTIDQAKSLLGWEEETDTVKFGGEFLFIDHNKHKVRCTNNLKNRPFGLQWAQALSQRILRNRWRGLNGETLVINKYGDTESAQHRLIGFVLAEQLRLLSDSQWIQHWPEELTLECIIVLGVEPDDSTINTLDTGRTRTLTDVLYRSHYFAHLKTDQRKIMARATDYAIRTVWKRTGMNNNVFTLFPDHSEYIAFLENHPKLLEAVARVNELNKDNCLALKPGPGLGYAAALMYLMACSRTDGNKYRETETPSEKTIEFTRWSDAIQFFKEFAYAIKHRPADTEFKPLCTAIANLKDDDGEGTASVDEIIALIIKAWYCFIDKKPLTAEVLKLKYHTDKHDICRLIEYPTLGGIDKEPDAESIAKDLAGDTLEERKKALREEKERAEAAKAKEPKEPVDEFGFPLTYETQVEGKQPDAETQEEDEEAPEPEPEVVKILKPTPTAKPGSKPKPEPFVMSEADKKLAAERLAKAKKPK